MLIFCNFRATIEPDRGVTEPPKPEVADTKVCLSLLLVPLIIIRDESAFCKNCKMTVQVDCNLTLTIGSLFQYFLFQWLEMNNMNRIKSCCI